MPVGYACRRGGRYAVGACRRGRERCRCLSPAMAACRRERALGKARYARRCHACVRHRQAHADLGGRGGRPAVAGRFPGSGLQGRAPEPGDHRLTLARSSARFRTPAVRIGQASWLNGSASRRLANAPPQREEEHITFTASAIYDMGTPKRWTGSDRQNRSDIRKTETDR